MISSEFPFGTDMIWKAYKDKDETYRKSMLDHFCWMANDFAKDFKRMLENYRLKNNQLSKSEYRYLCGVFGTEETTDVFIDAYNHTGNIIDALKGEELGRPFPFMIVANSPRITNRLERKKLESVTNIIESIFALELEKAKRIMELETKQLEGKIDPKQMDQAKAEIEKDIMRRFKKIPQIKQVVKEYDSMTTIEELTMNKVTKVMYNKLNIKSIKNDCFEDLLTTGHEYAEVHTEHSYSMPKITRRNPLQVFFQKSPNTKYIQDGDFVGYREIVTINDALQEYGEYLSEEDYHDVMVYGANWGVTGMNWNYWSDGKNPNPIDQQRFSRFNSGYTGMAETEWVNVENDEYGSPDFGYIPGRPNDVIGLHTTLQRRNMNHYTEKYVCYWKSKRKLGKLTYYNEFGEIEVTFVDEFFKAPKKAKRVITKQDNLAKDIVEIYWMDSRGKKVSLEWILINEVWKGVRIGRKHVLVEPLEHAYKSLANPYEVKLPIYGLVHNNTNAKALSVMDKMKPWQKLYFALMSKFLKLIHQDKGTWLFLNSLYFDSKLGVEKTMAMAEDQGYVIYNPLSTAKGGNATLLQSLGGIQQSVNTTNFQAISQYLEILRFIEENIQKAAGMSPQRIAQTSQNSTATDNYRETQSSMNITEPLFYAHDMLWEKIMNGYLEMCLSVLSNNSGILRDVLNDEERTMIDLDYVSLTDNYRLRVGNSGKQNRVLDTMKELSQALIQNDKIGMADLATLLETENLQEFKVYLREAEKEMQERMENMQKQQQEHEQEMLAKEKEIKEDEQIARLNEIYLKGKMDYNRDQMRQLYENQSFDAEKDYNRDGIADYLQLEQMQQKINNESRKIDLEEMKYLRDAELKSKELETKERELQETMRKTDVDASLTEAEMKNKEKLEKIKAQMRAKKKS